MSEILRTSRLRLRLMSEDDAPFFLALVNDPAFIEHIGDRAIRSLDGARAALRDGPVAMQARHGHSLYLVELLADGTPVGMSGLVRRAGLDDVDLGYAFLPAWRGQGHAFEAAVAVREHACALGLARLAAVVAPGNAASVALLRRLGMRFEREVRLAPDRPAVDLYLLALRPASGNG